MKRAPNGSVPRYCDPGYRTSYQKQRERLLALKLVSRIAADLLEESYALPYMNKRAWRLWCAAWRARAELIVKEIRKL